MAARAAADLPEVQALALVGFVVRWEHLPADTLDRLARFRGPVLAVCAENDHHGSPDEVRRLMADIGLRPKIEVIEGADHYLGGRSARWVGWSPTSSTRCCPGSSTPGRAPAARSAFLGAKVGPWSYSRATSGSYAAAMSTLPSKRILVYVGCGPGGAHSGDHRTGGRRPRPRGRGRGGSQRERHRRRRPAQRR